MGKMDDPEKTDNTLTDDDQDERNTKPKVARYAEGIFCIVYLIFIAAIVLTAFWKYSITPTGLRHSKLRLKFSFAFFMGMLLLIGDGFHLVPRIIVAFRGNMWKKNVFLGIGNILSSITMTFFYNLLLMMGDSIEYSGAEFNLVLETAIKILTIIRVIIVLLPMNKWFSEEGSRTWAIIRNSVFSLIGILTVFGLCTVIRNAYMMPGEFYMSLILLTILSFVFYLPVAINGKKNPKLGMLMMPKSICYMAMMSIIVFWPMLLSYGW